ncbi:hypothetical protein QQX98_000670 [Neonectria punicea]|uniref:Uncharacterized protein n=1 Tax=Neonectria punicea TaxID=979145 RepID=A0ABR1HS83_9HYPO
MTAPPSYQEAGAGRSVTDDQPPLDLTASFANLDLGLTARDPDPNTCLAHLRLLFAFENLKEDIGYTDGLWGLWDSRAEGNMEVPENADIKGHVPNGSYPKIPEEKHRLLSMIREKRWALFVARAVDRYEAWWNSLVEGPRLTEEDMAAPDSAAYLQFTAVQDLEYWKGMTLPPLDVLMVYHAHMLNPYNFLEDCLRAGHRHFWASGMPWSLVNAAIDPNFNYNVSDDDKARWVAKTGHSWHNSDDATFKSINCPVCNSQIIIPWTTCGLDEHPKTSDWPGLIGSGYGDGKLDASCPTCATRINKEFLSLAKFCNDARDLLTKDVPMPGTVTHPLSGEPKEFHKTHRVRWNPHTFPNRMIKLVLRIEIQDLLKTPSLGDPPTVDDVRKMIEVTLDKQSALRLIYQGSPNSLSLRPVRVSPLARLSIRKMMSRYWDNFSPFALDLCGAVMRQGIFSEKMRQIDWLHSPAAPETMKRLCIKYQRFIKVIAQYPKEVAVPTLDVDLAWHTHQLSPSAYYMYTKTVAHKFIRHDDKIEEDNLKEGFEWTSKTYQESYVEEKFHSSGAASLCPPDNSAHISSHNAVKLSDDAMVLPPGRRSVQRQIQELHQQRLEENYQKARKRAEKKGRKLPPREQYYEHWGYSYYSKSETPWRRRSVSPINGLLQCTDLGCIPCTLREACTMVRPRVMVEAPVHLEVVEEAWPPELVAVLAAHARRVAVEEAEEDVQLEEEEDVEVEVEVEEEEEAVAAEEEEDVEVEATAKPAQ